MPHRHVAAKPRHQEEEIKTKSKAESDDVQNTNKYIKVKTYKKTSRATSNVGYQTNVEFRSASSSTLELIAHNCFILFFIYLFIYFIFCFFFVLRTIYLFIMFCVVIMYFIRAYDTIKVYSASFVLEMASFHFLQYIPTQERI